MQAPFATLAEPTTDGRLEDNTTPGRLDGDASPHGLSDACEESAGRAR
jgi:hypothetical protein